MDKFKNKYRLKSARAEWWDYSWGASYFVTICTKNRKHFFGHIRQGKMYLSDIGERVQMEWLKTPEIRPDMNLTLGEFVVMPNHFHAIITIGEMGDNGARYTFPNVETRCGCENVEMRCIASLPTPLNRFGPQSKNLASIIRGFKSSVTTYARKSGNTHFHWQPRFHDRIIRDERAYENITNYILNNPLKWEQDRFY